MKNVHLMVSDRLNVDWTNMSDNWGKTSATILNLYNIDVIRTLLS